MKTPVSIVAAQLHWLAILAFALLSIRCTTVLYGGRRLPGSQVAVIGHDGATHIATIDDNPVANSMYYEVLPGLHAVKMRGVEHEVESHLFYTTQITRLFSPLRACFLARSGRTYEVRSGHDGDIWTYEIIDEVSENEVTTPCPRSAIPH
jgi:hypothetical protein